MLGEQRAPRVLIVDDTPEVRAFVSEALRTLGYEVHTAAWANEALELMARTRFTVVLCDLRLPGVRVPSWWRSFDTLIRACRNHPDWSFVG
jgi:CheY-like chemotaxis protein